MPRSEDKPAVELAAPHRVGGGHWLALLLIILFGTALRFAYLDHPTLWGDEAATWIRTCGTFQQLLANNKGDGFVPLHYELYWAMGKLWPMNPWRMRLVPAITGSLMIPAMYFLARQLVRPSTALLVALLTACSAYMLNYARDAKMYMEFWFFLTLHMGALLWWLRGGGATAWWTWVASGVGMVGLQSAGWLVVPIELVMVLCGVWRGAWWRVGFRWVFFVLGLALVGVGPAVYYWQYNQWMRDSGGIAPGTVESTDAGANWGQSGIAWIEPLTRGKTGPQLVRDSASAYLLGYSRAEELDVDGRIPIEPWVLNTVWGLFAGTILVLLMGVIHWPGKRLREPVGLEPWSGWRLAFWLTLWLVLPTYCVFYCHSATAPASPLDWMRGIHAFFGGQWGWMIPVLLVASLLAGWSRWLNWTLALLLWLAMAGVIGWSVKTGHAEWYLTLMDYGQLPWLVGGLLVLAGAVTWANSGDRFGRRLGVLLLTLLWVAIILAICQATWQVCEHLREKAADAGLPWQSIWMPRYLAVIWPAVALVLAITICRLPSRLLRFAVILVFVNANLVQYGARLVVDGEPRLDLVAQDIVKGYRDASVRVFVRDRWPIGSPATASMSDGVGRFHLAVWMGGTYSPMEMKEYPTEYVCPYNRFLTVRQIASDLRRRPTVQRLVIWDRKSVSLEDPQTMESALGPDWKLMETRDYPIYRHWNWQYMDNFRRLEFARTTPFPIPPSATRPATQPRKLPPASLPTTTLSPW